MTKMPQMARLYWILVCVLGVGAVAASQFIPLPQRIPNTFEFVAFLVLAFLIGGKRISLNKLRKGDEAGSMSIGFAITYVALLRFGPGLAVTTGVLSCLSSCVFPKRQQWHQLTFNVCLSGIETLIGGLVFAWANGWALTIDPVRTIPAVAASSACFFLVNTGGVATMISLYTAETPFKVWKENFLWTAPSYFASACIGALAIPVFSRSAFVVLLVLPVAYFIYQSYVTHISRAEDRQRHIDELQVKQTQLTDVYLSTIQSMALAIDAKDQYTHQHITRVQRYAIALAEEMGLEGDELKAVQTGALLHDIGKLGVPEYVLLKPGPLSPDEFEKVKKHPEIGAAILDPVEFPWPVIPIVRHHHEKWNGTGYPDGLAGEDIPLTARIMAVADVFDAVTSTRSYRQAWSYERAIEMISKEAGSHFDPKVVEAFLRVIGVVVSQMAHEGTGPLVAEKSGPPKAPSKASEAARVIARASTELWALYEVAQSLSSSLGIKNTAQLIAQKVEQIYPGATCAFLLWDADSRTLVADSAFGVNREFFASAHSVSETSVSVTVIETNTAYFGSFDTNDLELGLSTAGEWIEPRTAVVVPVSCNGRPLGTINVYHSAENAFSENDRQLLELIAERAASALHNGMVFDRARDDALTDPLTQAYNLRFLAAHVDSLCEERSVDGAGESGLAVLCLDLDSFKPVNDGFGHSKGDEVLRDLAKVFTDVVKSQGIVARCGGDEFVVVLDAASSEDADDMAVRLQHAVETYDPGLNHFKLGQLRLGVSVGVACHPQDGHDCTSLLSVADHRMYAMKTERKLQSLAKGWERAAGAA